MTERILIAADHAGFELKEKLEHALENLGFDVQDLGTDSADSTDYADYAHPLAQKVSSGEAQRGVGRGDPSDKNGPFGPGAVGVSAFSNVLTGWTQGGPIAIHGTNAPWSIGKAVSNGCIRIPNPVMAKLFRLTLSGTPVLIRV